MKCNIVLLHGQVSTSAGTDRVATARLRNRGIDYLALGHLHTYQTDVLDARGVWGYAGCPEGRGFDEPGEKGFIVLETDFGAIKYRFIPFAVRTLHQCNVDISTDRTVLQQEEHVLQTLSTVSERDMVRVVLTGAVPPEQYIDAGAIQKMLRSRFFAARVQNATTLALDDAVLANELSLRGAFYRLVQAEDLSEDDRAAILRAGFAALSGEEIPTEFHSR